MNTAGFLSLGAACVMAGSLIAHGQTETLVARPGYYRGTMTMTAPEFDGEKAPVKSAFPVAARVGESPTIAGKVHAAIRLRPAPDINAPLPNFVLRWDGAFSTYVVFQGNLSGGSATPGEVKQSRNRLVITTKFGQSSAEGVLTFADVRITLTRVGD